MDSFDDNTKKSDAQDAADNMDGEKIEGYSSGSNDSLSSVTGSSLSSCCTKSRQQDDDLDLMDDVERILSRPSISRRILPIFEAPEFAQRMRSYDEAELGDSVTFTAQYRALPKPTVKWFKDEQEVRPSDRHVLDASSESDGIIRLIVHDVVAGDEGAYKCKVENSEGVASTTGYLSVARKPSTRSRSSRTSGKLSGTPDRISSGISTPPLLGPIAEQKSMEESEEMELSRQPPSPLQDFIDSIRRGAKSRRGGPIVYATADIFATQDDTASEDDIFGNDSYTPTGTPDNGLESGSDEADLNDDILHDDAATAVYVCAIDSFQSPEIDLSSSHSSTSPTSFSAQPPSSLAALYTRQSSKDDSAYDSDSHEDERTTTDKKLSQTENDENINDAAPTPKLPSISIQRTRLRHFQLKRRQAVDMPESNLPVDESTSGSDSELNVAFETQTGEADTRPTISACSCTQNCTYGASIAEPVMCNLEDSCGIALETVLGRQVHSLDSPEVQFGMVFVAFAATFATALQVSPIWLVLLVAAVVILHLSFVNWRTKQYLLSSNKTKLETGQKQR